MGCDIHCYVEYRNPKSEYDPTRWNDFGGQINPGRNYRIFGALAGVRHGQPKGCVPARGIPPDLAWQAHGDWWVYVTDDEPTRADDGEGGIGDAAMGLMRVCLAHPKEDTPRKMLLDALQEWNGHDEAGRDSDWPRIGGVTRERADAWVSGGRRDAVKYNHDRSAVEHPDWHTPTWLTPDEWEFALKAAGQLPGTEPEYYAMLAAMRSLEAGGFEVRCVMWFDN